MEEAHQNQYGTLEALDSPLSPEPVVSSPGHYQSTNNPASVTARHQFLVSGSSCSLNQHGSRSNSKTRKRAMLTQRQSQMKRKQKAFLISNQAIVAKDELQLFSEPTIKETGEKVSQKQQHEDDDDDDEDDGYSEENALGGRQTLNNSKVEHQHLVALSSPDGNNDDENVASKKGSQVVENNE